MSATQENLFEENNGPVIGTNYGPIKIGNEQLNKESQLRKILNSILESPIDEEATLDTSAYSIMDKLDYNNINEEWYDIITLDFVVHENIIIETFSESNDGIPSQSKFLHQMTRYYRKAKHELNLDSDCQKSIKENSTNILNRVFSYIYQFLKSKNEIYEHFDEDNIKVLVAFGFVECKILEKPKG